MYGIPLLIRRTNSMRTLHLTQDQFDVLYDLLEDTINDISDNIEDMDITLDDYEIYKVYQQLNRLEGKS